MKNADGTNAIVGANESLELKVSKNRSPMEKVDSIVVSCRLTRKESLRGSVRSQTKDLSGREIYWPVSVYDHDHTRLTETLQSCVP